MVGTIRGHSGPHPALWTMIAGLLLVPLVAMQFTDEVAWDGSDFLAAIVLLGSAGLALELTPRLVANRRGRLVAGAGIVTLAALIWAQGAVGIF